MISIIRQLAVVIGIGAAEQILAELVKSFGEHEDA